MSPAWMECDHDPDDFMCEVCGWPIESVHVQISHPDDMPATTGPERVAQAVARDRGGWAPRGRVQFSLAEVGLTEKNTEKEKDR